MKKLTCLIVVCTLMELHSQGAPVPVKEPGVRLTVELRDGSRINGKPPGDILAIHSTALGDVKLSWATLRTIEYPADGASDIDTAHLIADNGDQITAQLSIDALRLQTAFGKAEFPLKTIHFIKVSLPNKWYAPGSQIAAKDAALKVTIDLRDGSHLLGKGLDDTIIVHSTAMGDLKLTWADIRSIEFPTPDTGSAQLRAVNGDIYEVRLAAPAVLLETSFGKSELPVKLISRACVSTEGNDMEHLIGWWKLDEGNGTVANDNSSSPQNHDGNLTNGLAWALTTGGNDVALQFGGGNQYVALGNILQESYPEISIACWVKHDKGSNLQEVVDRGVWNDPDGIALVMDCQSYSVQFGHFASNVTSKADVQDNQWHHIVGTLSQNGGNYVYNIYVDGKLDNTATSSMGLTATSGSWAIGARSGGGWAYEGLIADVRIYDHALSASDVETIYGEQDHGDPTAPATKLPAPPADANSNSEIIQGTDGGLNK